MFSVEIVETTGAWIVRCKGEIDLSTAPDLRATFGALASDTERDLIVDLTDVSFIDSTGLRALIEAHRLANASGRKVSVRGSSPAAQRLFEITQLNQLIEIS